MRDRIKALIKEGKSKEDIIKAIAKSPTQKTLEKAVDSWWDHVNTQFDRGNYSGVPHTSGWIKEISENIFQLIISDWGTTGYEDRIMSDLRRFIKKAIPNTKVTQDKYGKIIITVGDAKREDADDKQVYIDKIKKDFEFKGKNIYWELGDTYVKLIGDAEDYNKLDELLEKGVVDGNTIKSYIRTINYHYEPLRRSRTASNVRYHYEDLMDNLKRLIPKFKKAFRDVDKEMTKGDK